MLSFFLALSLPVVQAPNSDPTKNDPHWQEIRLTREIQSALGQTRPLRFVIVKDETKERELKIQGRGFWRASARPGSAAQQLVIRDAAEAARASGLPADGKGQELASANLAKALKAEKIDWDKQMVVVATGGAKPTGGYRVEILGLTLKDKELIVKWKLHSPKPGSFVTQAFTHPAEAVLVEKVNAKVVFDPLAPKAGGGPEK
jgi:hypothetical protein